MLKSAKLYCVGEMAEDTNFAEVGSAPRTGSEAAYSPGNCNWASKNNTIECTGIESADDAIRSRLMRSTSKLLGTTTKSAVNCQDT